VPASATCLKWLDFSDGSDVHAVYRDAETRLYSQQQLAATSGEYYTLSTERAAELAVAAEELHDMFIAATDKVLNDESLLLTFRIPKSLHARVRSSFASHRAGLGEHPICGRLDLSVHETEAKVRAPLKADHTGVFVFRLASRQ
jgi:glutathionylspermidine amidase/synthetase